MAWIHFAKNSYPSLQVPVGSNLMQVLLAHNIPVSSSCGGDGVCGKCRLQVKSSVSTAVSAVSELEQSVIKKILLQKTFVLVVNA